MHDVHMDDIKCLCAVAEWKGELVVEGGGFCGIASTQQSHDLSAYDGTLSCFHSMHLLASVHGVIQTSKA